MHRLWERDFCRLMLMRCHTARSRLNIVCRLRSISVSRPLHSVNQRIPPSYLTGNQEAHTTVHLTWPSTTGKPVRGTSFVSPNPLPLRRRTLKRTSVLMDGSLYNM